MCHLRVHEVFHVGREHETIVCVDKQKRVDTNDLERALLEQLHLIGLCDLLEAGYLLAEFDHLHDERHHGLGKALTIRMMMMMMIIAAAATAVHHGHHGERRRVASDAHRRSFGIATSDLLHGSGPELSVRLDQRRAYELELVGALDTRMLVRDGDQLGQHLDLVHRLTLLTTTITTTTSDYIRRRYVHCGVCAAHQIAAATAAAAAATSTAAAARCRRGRGQ